MYMFETQVVVNNCLNKEFGFGYNAATETYEDLFANGILDPCKVIGEGERRDPNKIYS
jgi:chaperonin GroEL (HSP60 family)